MVGFTRSWFVCLRLQNLANFDTMTPRVRKDARPLDLFQAQFGRRDSFVRTLAAGDFSSLFDVGAVATSASMGGGL